MEQFDNLSRKALRVIIYKGKDKTKTIKEFIFKKGYANGFQEIYQYIKDQLPVSEEIKKRIIVQEVDTEGQEPIFDDEEEVEIQIM